jgi:hypothetical protein
MSIQLSEFQLANGGDDDLLPLYIQKNQETKIIGKKNIFLFSMVLFILGVTYICVRNFIVNTSLVRSQFNDDDLYYRFK